MSYSRFSDYVSRVEPASDGYRMLTNYNSGADAIPSGTDSVLKLSSSANAGPFSLSRRQFSVGANNTGSNITPVRLLDALGSSNSGNRSDLSSETGMQVGGDYARPSEAYSR